MKKKVEKLNWVRNLVVYPIFYLDYVITISRKCQISPQPPPPPLWAARPFGGGWGKETADASDYNHIWLIAIWNEPVSTSLSTCYLLFSP